MVVLVAVAVIHLRPVRLDVQRVRVRDSRRVDEARHITIISSSLDVVERRVRLRLRGYDGRGCRRRRRRVEGERREVLK